MVFHVDSDLAFLYDICHIEPINCQEVKMTFANMKAISIEVK